MGSKKKKFPEGYMPWWETAPLDPNRPMLEQFEEHCLNETDEEEFQRQLDWLNEKYYKNRDRLSLLEDTRDIISVSTPGEKDTIH
jgi:hypothetical protein